MWIDLDDSLPLENGTYRVIIKNIDDGNTIEAKAKWTQTAEQGIELIERNLKPNQFIKKWWSVDLNR